MNTTIATSSKETQTKLFDRSSDKNYIDTLIKFFDNAKRVDDEADEAKRQADEAFKAAHNAMSMFVYELNYYRNLHGGSTTQWTDSSKGGGTPPAPKTSQPTYTMTWDRQWKNGAPVDERYDDSKRIVKRRHPSAGVLAPVYAVGKPTIVGVRCEHK